MKVFDFDKTIYRRDSSTDFYFFCLGRHPRLIFGIFGQIGGFLKYFLKKATLTEAKEKFFSYVSKLPDPEKEAELFWESHFHGIYGWYFKEKGPDDVVISASPDLILRPICEKLGVKKLICTRMDPKTGKITGENNRGAEKTRRFREELAGAEIEAFYSDSIADKPMADMAKTAFLIKKGNVLPWNDTDFSKSQHLWERIFGR